MSDVLRRSAACGIAALGIAVGAVHAQDLASGPADRKDVSLTIYNNDLSLVRETRGIPVRRGAYRLRYEGVTSGIDATTVHLAGRGVRIVEQNYEYDLVSRDRLMQKYVGRDVSYRQPDGTLGRARLLAMNEGPVYEMGGKMDVRIGGTYRLVFSHQGSEMAFFGRYIEVTPHSRLVWTNDEGGDDGAVTTVSFEERDGKTLVVLHDLYPSKEAPDASGSISGMDETLDQLDELVGTLGRSSGRS